MTDTVTMIPVSSTAVIEAGFDEAEGAIYVRFTRGALYRYDDATLSDFENFINAPSVGRAIPELTKNHPYEQVG